MVAKDAEHLAPVMFPKVRPIRIPRSRLCLKRLRENTVVRPEPVEPAFRRKLQSLIRDRTFRRPETRRSYADPVTRITPRPGELLPRVFGVPKSARQRNVGMCDRRNVRVAHKRENRVIVRRCGYLDLSTLGSFAIGRNNLSDYFELLATERPLIFHTEVASPGRKSLYNRVAGQELFVEPRQLR